MAIEPKIYTFSCPSDEIAEYIDGELDGAKELELEGHIAGCSLCSVELNQQKQFLRHLDIGLRQEKELELPVNFAKLIVANAESTVSGLRRPRERFNAIFICAGLMLFALFALGAEAVTLLNNLSGIFVQTAAVGSFFGHLIYSVLTGLAIVVRSFAAQLQPGVAAVALMSIIFAAFSLYVSRKILNTLRAG
ncbi:MAG: anti-sigma factor family protein [Pyrinomonadaceae bacterium]